MLKQYIVVRLRKLRLLLEAFWMLLKAHLLLKGSYASLRRQMTIGATRDSQVYAQELISAVVGAVNRACRYYPKSPACLQRSLALASMLRKRGIPADLQIGVRQSPFDSHAWVEVTGIVINDVPGIRDIYPALHQFKATPQR